MQHDTAIITTTQYSQKTNIFDENLKNNSFNFKNKTTNDVRRILFDYEQNFTIISSNNTIIVDELKPKMSSPSTMRICLFMICVIGIALNMLVFRRNNYSRCFLIYKL